MTLIDCLKDPRVIAGDRWFRPVGDIGQAFCVREGYTERVPNDRGGIPMMTWSVRKLAGEWEIVSSDTVIEERHRD